MHDIRKLIIY